MSHAELLKPVFVTSILLIVFGLGLKARWRDALFLFHEPELLLRSSLAMNVVMPLFVLTLITAFKLTPAVEVALVVLSVSPVPPVLPMKQLKCSGHESYVYGLLVMASLFAVIFVPLVVSVLGRIIGVEAPMASTSIARIVLLTIFLPLGAGMLLRQVTPDVAEQVAKLSSQTGGLLLLIGLLIVLTVAWRAMFTLVGNGTVLAMVAFVAVGLAAGHLLGGPAPEDRSTLALATVSRHPGVAISIAATDFQEVKFVSAAILLYLIVNALATIPYVLWRKHRLTHITE